MRHRLMAAAVLTGMVAAGTTTPVFAQDTATNTAQTGETITLVLPGVTSGDELPRVEVAAPHNVIAPDGTHLGLSCHELSGLRIL